MFIRVGDMLLNTDKVCMIEVREASGGMPEKEQHRLMVQFEGMSEATALFSDQDKEKIMGKLRTIEEALTFEGKGFRD